MRLTLIAILFIAGLAFLYASDPAPYPNIPEELREPTKKMSDFFPAMKQGAQVIEPEAASGFEQKAAVESDGDMVVTAHPLASRTAHNILHQGGSAIDAVIAAQMMLNLVEPQSSGIGGGGFLLYYDAKTNALTAYDGRETSPAAFDPESFLRTVNVDGSPAKVKQSFKEALSGAVSVGTPGLLAMLDAAHKDHGALEWRELFQPSITKAKDGFKVTPRLKKLLDYAPNIHENFPFQQSYVADAYDVGSVVTNPNFATALELISTQGIAAFYQGDIAQHLVEAVQKETPAGTLTLKDLANYKAIESEALCSPYRAYMVCSPPPPSGGVTLQHIMAMLQHFKLNQYDKEDVEGWHLLAEATRLAFTDRRYVSDSSAMRITGKELLNPDYIEQRVALLRLNERSDEIQKRDAIYFDPPSTTHLSVVGAQGNIASLTSSIEHAFGAGVMVDGFFLNNQLTDFDWRLNENMSDEIFANLTAPNKRPRSSMSPTIVFDAQKRPVLVIGSPGGSRIIPYIAKTLVALLDWNMPLDEAIALPHIVAGTDGKIAYEPSAPPALIRQLKAMGHEVYERELTSGLHAIQLHYEGDEARYIGAADPRREGMALGNTIGTR